MTAVVGLGGVVVMAERWRPVRMGMRSTRYDVSDMGRVRNRVTGLILAPYHCPTRRGCYLKVALYCGRDRVQRYVHRLVAEAFIPNARFAPEVDHCNCDAFDNRAANLEWVTRTENERRKHAFDRFWNYAEAVG
jgi:hypothetical protein